MIIKIKRCRNQIYISLAIVILFISATWYTIPLLSQLIKRVDNVIYDIVLRQYWHSKPPKVDVVIIDIDTKSMNEQGKWPWPRDKIATLIKKLKDSGVVVVALDIVMTEEDINYAKGLKDKLLKLPAIHRQSQMNQFLSDLVPLVDNDAILAKVMSNQEVVLGILFHHESQASKGSLPKPLSLKSPINQFKLHKFDGHSGNLPLLMSAAKNSGFVSNVPDEDGTIRKGILIASYKGKPYASLSLQAAMTYLLSGSISLAVDQNKLIGIKLDDSFIPTTEKGEILLPFYGEAGTLAYYSATDIINDRIPKSALKGSIAVVGSSMILISDLHPTPVSSLYPGAEMIGSMITGIISQHIIYPYVNNSLANTLLISAIGCSYAILFPIVSMAVMLIILSLSLAIIATIFIVSFVHFQMYIPIGILVLIIISQAIVNMIYAYILEKRQKRKISHLFGQYVPESYVHELIKSDELVSMEGELRDMTALFSDIRNFTTLSQSLHASEVKRILNAFFTPITKIIFDNKGTIDKYVGDLVMAFWGAPMSDPKHAQHGIEAALTIIDKLPAINQTMQEQNLPNIFIGIGLASGEMNIGDMGSEFRRSYTVIGDTVNLAARLESLTKFYQVDILVNEAITQQVTGIVWLPVDKVMVKGRDIPETIYEPLGKVNQISSELLSTLQQYQSALSYYYDQNWLQAKAIFQYLAQLNPDKQLFQIYLQRVEMFIKIPPAKDWQGVYVHESK